MAENKVAHLFLVSTHKIHHDSKKFNGGRCIAKHKILTKEGKTENNHPGYVEYCSCSYRWHGKHSKNNNSGIYNKDRPELVAIIRNGTARDDVAQAPEKVKQEIAAFKKALYLEGVREQGIKASLQSKRTRNWYPENYGRELNLPRENTKGDWYLNGPLEAGYKNVNKLNVYRFSKKKAKLKNELELEINKKEAEFGRDNKKTIPVGANFTKEFWPYWNNHHHLIPAGILKKLMQSIANEHNIEEQVFFDGIAASPYNLHSRKNVQILPRDRSVSLLLSLPRHLRHEEPLIDKEGKLIKGNFFDHPQYSEEVELELEPILTKAASYLAKDGKEHPDPITKQADIGRRLDKISKKLSGKLLKLGGMAKLPVSADHLLRTLKS